MAGHVRVNTLQSLEWAMSLTDPAERRAALEAINKMSLSGIGARIEVDETGFPKIRETTVLSAVAATGQVAPGDYIVGMEDASGEAVNFEGLPARQVAQHLRGEPGSELRLQMERVAPDGSEAYSYEVTIQRSLLVIQPPF
jgi:C-terminal processing protease CtpA/Prc